MRVLNLPYEQVPDEPSLEIFPENMSGIFNDIKNMPPSEQLYEICERFIKPDTIGQKAGRESVLKLNQLIKQIQDFENVFGVKETKSYLL
ncbi:hypothetical protein tpqmel_0824 [Candidatus Gastranaerophilus sp. (ex Termes propinquus)]|nr:hypothetical protein tpqmel_0824 [Candidatus Gastranaerophilus sp. (ex Termes propinquus)]